jgi:hypothetical protein
MKKKLTGLCRKASAIALTALMLLTNSLEPGTPAAAVQQGMLLMI